jgi:hypothetical protein
MPKKRCPYRKARLSFFSYTYRHPVLTVNLPLLTIPLFQDQILISKILVGRKTSEVVENTDELSFGEGQVCDLAPPAQEPRAFTAGRGARRRAEWGHERRGQSLRSILAAVAAGRRADAGTARGAGLPQEGCGALGR